MPPIDNQPSPPPGSPVNVAVWRRLLEEPNDPAALNCAGNAFAKAGNGDQAVFFLAQAVAAQQQNARYYCDMAWALLRFGRSLEAACAFRQALACDSKFPEAFHGLGVALVALGQPALGAASMQKAVAVDPKNSQALSDLAIQLSENGDYGGAEKAALRALRLDPNSLGAHGALSESRFACGRLNGAVSRLRKVARRRSDSADAHYELARVLDFSAKLDAAHKQYQTAVQLNPNHVDGHFGVACTLLAKGRFSEAWPEYEWRFRLRRARNSPQAHFANQIGEPMWAGEEFAGKTLLIHGEQGYGDQIQFIRYASILGERNCRVIVVTYPELGALLRNVPGVVQVIRYGELAPRFDYHVALCSIPKVMGTTLESIPARVPYLSPSAERVIPGLEEVKIGERLRVGFVWRTRKINAFDFRSIPLEDFSAIFEAKEIDFYSLQVGAGSEEIKQYLRLGNVKSLSERLSDFDVTAAFISKMDLVISIDTAAAHLAGALAVPVWVLLPFKSEWRWLNPKLLPEWRERSPWYPTMRLVRASKPFSWLEPIAEVKALLSKLKRSGA